MKARGSTPELPLRLHRLNPGEVSGIPSVEVKFVDIRKNTSGEGGSLVFLRISTNFTSTLAVPLTSPGIKLLSIKGSSGVELQDFTPDLRVRLRALYAQ